LAALELFTSIERMHISPWIWMLLIWFLFVVPVINLRGFHLEKGTVVALARGALEDGHGWFLPITDIVSSSDRC
jgi:hypothetical protein